MGTSIEISTFSVRVRRGWTLGAVAPTRLLEAFHIRSVKHLELLLCLSYLSVLVHAINKGKVSGAICPCYYGTNDTDVTARATEYGVHRKYPPRGLWVPSHPNLRIVYMAGPPPPTAGRRCRAAELLVRLPAP